MPSGSIGEVTGCLYQWLGVWIPLSTDFEWSSSHPTSLLQREKALKVIEMKLLWISSHYLLDKFIVFCGFGILVCSSMGKPCFVANIPTCLLVWSVKRETNTSSRCSTSNNGRMCHESSTLTMLHGEVVQLKLRVHLVSKNSHIFLYRK